MATSKKTSSSTAPTLEETLAGINETFGEGTAGLLNSEPRHIDVIPTGILELDTELQVGGFPRGRIVEMYGPEAGGKSTIALHVVAECQRMGKTAVYIDLENAMNDEYAESIGVDMSKLVLSQPGTTEQALEIIERFLPVEEVGLVVVDSVAAMVPRAEMEGDFGDANVGLQARLMSQGLRKLAMSIGKTNTTVIFINQLRDKVGVVYGSPETTPGGKALKFYASVRLDVRRGDLIKGSGDVVVGNYVKAKITKTRVGNPYRTAVFELTYGEGITRAASILNMATARGIIKKSGNWFNYEGEQLGNGSTQARVYLKEHPQLMEEIAGRLQEAPSE